MLTGSLGATANFGGDDLVTAATFSGDFDFAGTQGSTIGPFGAESTAVARLRP